MRKLLLLIALGCSHSNIVHATEPARYLKIDATKIECSGDSYYLPYHVTIGLSHFVILPQMGYTKLYYDQSSGEDGINKLKVCEMARLQARSDGNSIYVNVNTGEVLPENGFFV
jgi:hypothetical protein